MRQFDARAAQQARQLVAPPPNLNNTQQGKLTYSLTINPSYMSTSTQSTYIHKQDYISTYTI